jgi:hypothetical protein
VRLDSAAHSVECRAFVGGERVDFVQGDQCGLARQVGVVEFQFAPKRFERLQRRRGRKRRHIQQVQQQPRALHMAQELMPQPDARMRALNQPRYIGDDEALVLVLHDAEVGHERCERVVGDFGLGGGDSANQRAFARVGHPDDADIGEQFQLQSQRAPFAGQALLSEAWGLSGGGGEVRVAASAFAPARRDEPHARARQVCQQVARVGVVDQRADGHTQRD